MGRERDVSEYPLLCCVPSSGEWEKEVGWGKFKPTATAQPVQLIGEGVSAYKKVAKTRWITLFRH